MADTLQGEIDLQREKEERRQHILSFLVAEGRYLDSLEDLYSSCISDLLVDCRNNRPSILAKSKYNNDLLVLLNEFEDILDLTRKIFKDISENGPSETVHTFDENSFWQAFFKFVSLLKLYGRYNAKFIKDHPLVDYLEVTYRKNKNFSAYLDSKFNGEVDALDQFLSELRLPGERIKEYLAMVNFSTKDFITPEVQGDKIEIQEYMETCEYNEKRYLEIKALEERWGGYSFYKENRHIIKEGPLIKSSRRKDVDYEFLLFNDILVYGSWTGGGTICHHRSLPLQNVDVESTGNRQETEFRIKSTEKSFAVRAKTVEVRNEWVLMLSQTIEENKAAIKEELEVKTQIEKSGIKLRPVSLRSASTGFSGKFGISFFKESSSSDIVDQEEEQEEDRQVGFAPVWDQDQQSRHCFLCHRDFTLLNRRHHCRKCGKVVCGKCSSNFIPANKVISGQDSSKKVRICDNCSDEESFTQIDNPVGEENSILKDRPSHEHSQSPRKQKTKAAMVYVSNQNQIQKVLDKIKIENDNKVEKSTRQRIVEEIFMTEQSYVHCLVIMLETYIEPILENAKLKDKTYGKICEKQSSDKVTSMDVFFHSVEKIFQVNMKLLCDLTTRVEGWNEEVEMTSSIGDIFKLYGSLFTTYTQYSDTQEFACKTIFECTQNENEVPGFCEFLSRVDAAPGYDLNSLLIKPIQRVPRYQLLLQEYLKKTKKSHPSHRDISLVEEALKDIVSSATRINETIRFREHLQKLMECQARWVGNTKYNFVASGRFLLHEGPLRKQCKRGLKEFYFILTSDSLVYGSSLPQRMGAENQLPDFYKFHRVFNLSSVQVSKIKVENDSSCSAYIKISSKEKTFVAGADSEFERDTWFDVIQNAIANFKTKRHSTADLQQEGEERREEDGEVDYAPLWVPDADHDKCSLCKDKFTALGKRRHHCRNCGKLVCGPCSSNYAILTNIDATKGSRICDECWKTEEKIKKAKKVARQSVWQNLKRGTIFNGYGGQASLDNILYEEGNEEKEEVEEEKDDQETEIKVEEEIKNRNLQEEADRVDEELPKIREQALQEREQEKGQQKEKQKEEGGGGGRKLYENDTLKKEMPPIESITESNFESGSDSDSDEEEGEADQLTPEEQASYRQKVENMKGLRKSFLANPSQIQQEQSLLLQNNEI